MSITVLTKIVRLVASPTLEEKYKPPVHPPMDTKALTPYTACIGMSKQRVSEATTYMFVSRFNELWQELLVRISERQLVGIGSRLAEEMG